MSLLNKITDLKFLKMLTTPFDKMDAYKLGIIDADGKLLKKKRERNTQAERLAYDTFTKLIVNIKRYLEMVPFLGTRLGSLAAALWLMREEVDFDDDELVGTFTQFLRENRIMDENQIKDLIEEYTSIWLVEDAPTTSLGNPPGNIAGVSDNDPPGRKKKKKRKKENGVDVFEVDSNILRSARISNRKRDKFIKAMGNTKLARELKQYFKTYPSAPLLLQDESGVMVRLRR